MRPRTRIRILPTAVASLLFMGIAVAMSSPASAATTLANAGFESGVGQSPSGWSESGTASASKSEAGGHSGSAQLAHWSASAYTVTTYQTLTGLTAGQYTASAWVRSGGGQSAAYLSLSNCGGSEVRANVPANTTWSQISVSTNVTSSQCTLGFTSNASANNWINVDDVVFTGGTTRSALPIRGADVSTLKKNEDKGAVYFDSAGVRRDALSILRSGGVNYARLKVWVNPADGYNNRARVLQMATRVKAAGMKLLVDFHYSDSWADPGKQVKPAAWASYSFTQLRDAVYNHTYDLCNALRAQGTPADMVQIGNEINPGMLLPTGSTNDWASLSALLTAGSTAAKAANSSTRVMLHLAEGGNNSLFRWWFDQATAFGVPFDVIGASYYPYWHGPLSGLQANLNDMASRYNKDVVVAETAYGFTLAQDDSEPNIFNSTLQQAGGYPATPQGQVDELRAVFNVVRNVPGGHGLGVFYWEPTWTARAGAGWDPTNPSSGDGWENQAMFDYNDRALPAIAVFGSA
jgi:arabinogalactan endo-1,4-beta-galactosidase